jgi:phenylacetate-CoA ligase
MPELAAVRGTREELESIQSRRLSALLAEILPLNRFYIRKLADAELEPEDLTSPADLQRLPFTTKAELLTDQEQHLPYGTIPTYPLDRYCRLHQTSGSTSQPLRWLDSAASWNWCRDCWRQIFAITGVNSEDRLFFAFSFGPFLGFWTAFEAATGLGYFGFPAGGMSSVARLRALLEMRATVLLCTPTYALHLAEVARGEKINLIDSAVRVLIVAGEPGGSIPPTRRRIEEAWGARVFDHYGMTETGPVAVECFENPGGLHVLETEYIAEIISPQSGLAVSPGGVGELVLTNLGRAGSPLMRYRTGDLVRADPRPCPCGRPYLRLDGGILGRGDDMISVRGNNVFPSALEALIRRFPEVAEYRVEIDASSALPELRVAIEPAAPELEIGLVERVQRAIRDELQFRAEVISASPGSLPRYEFKANRIHHKGTKDTKQEQSKK